MRKKSNNILNENDIIKKEISKKLSSIAQKIEKNNTLNELDIFREKIKNDRE